MNSKNWRQIKTTNKMIYNKTIDKINYFNNLIINLTLKLKIQYSWKNKYQSNLTNMVSNFIVTITKFFKSKLKNIILIHLNSSKIIKIFWNRA